MKRLIATFTIIILCTFIATAGQDGANQDRRGEGQRDRRGRGFLSQLPNFAELDKNKDNKISSDEFPGPSQFFERVDENRDGGIDETEWKRVRERMANNAGRISEPFMRLLDANKDVKISRDEFNNLLQIFDKLDRDHDGQLSPEELGGFFQAMNEMQAQSTGGVEVENLFEKFDKNKDGRLSSDEMTNERTFKALDLDKDNLVTKSEAEQSLKQLAERSRQKKQAEEKKP
jgi:Ca2+-binding EF-hand superfamily protein